MSDTKSTTSTCSPSPEQMTQPDADGSMQVGGVLLCSGLDSVCNVLSVGKRKFRARSQKVKKKKRKLSQSKLLSASDECLSVVVDHSDVTEDLFPEDLTGSVSHNFDDCVNPFGDLGSQVKLFDTFCDIGICKRPCVRCLKTEKTQKVIEVVHDTVSLFNVQTPVGVTHLVNDSSVCDEIPVCSFPIHMEEPSFEEVSSDVFTGVCNGGVVCEKKKRKKHEHLKDWCPPGALDIVNEGIHNLTDPRYGICSVKRVLSQTESIILSFGPSFIPIPKPVSDKKVMESCDKYANSVRGVYNRYHKVDIGGKMSDIDFLLRVGTYSYPRASDTV
jgi:hypothetical protein